MQNLALLSISFFSTHQFRNTRKKLTLKKTALRTCVSVLDEEDERSRDLLPACNVWLNRCGQPKFPFAGFRSTALRITSSTASLVVLGKLWEAEFKLIIFSILQQMALILNFLPYVG